VAERGDDRVRGLPAALEGDLVGDRGRPLEEGRVPSVAGVPRAAGAVVGASIAVCAPLAVRASPAVPAERGHAGVGHVRPAPFDPDRLRAGAADRAELRLLDVGRHVHRGVDPRAGRVRRDRRAGVARGVLDDAVDAELQSARERRRRAAVFKRAGREDVLQFERGAPVARVDERRRPLAERHPVGGVVAHREELRERPETVAGGVCPDLRRGRNRPVRDRRVGEVQGRAAVAAPPVGDGAPAPGAGEPPRRRGRSLGIRSVRVAVGRHQ